jgi:hypothetical protein
VKLWPFSKKPNSQQKSNKFALPDGVMLASDEATPTPAEASDASPHTNPLVSPAAESHRGLNPVNESSTSGTWEAMPISAEELLNFDRQTPQTQGVPPERSLLQGLAIVNHSDMTPEESLPQALDQKLKQRLQETLARSSDSLASPEPATQNLTTAQPLMDLMPPAAHPQPGSHEIPPSALDPSSTEIVSQLFLTLATQQSQAAPETDIQLPSFNSTPTAPPEAPVFMQPDTLLPPMPPPNSADAFFEKTPDISTPSGVLPPLESVPSPATFHPELAPPSSDSLASALAEASQNMSFWANENDAAETPQPTASSSSTELFAENAEPLTSEVAPFWDVTESGGATADWLPPSEGPADAFYFNPEHNMPELPPVVAEQPGNATPCETSSWLLNDSETSLSALSPNTNDFTDFSASGFVPLDLDTSKPNDFKMDASGTGSMSLEEMPVFNLDEGHLPDETVWTDSETATLPFVCSTDSDAPNDTFDHMVCESIIEKMTGSAAEDIILEEPTTDDASLEEDFSIFTNEATGESGLSLNAESYELGHYEDPDAPSETFTLEEVLPVGGALLSLDNALGSAGFADFEIVEALPEIPAIPDVPPPVERPKEASPQAFSQVLPPQPVKKAPMPKSTTPYQPGSVKLYNESIAAALHDFETEVLLQDTRFLKKSIDSLVERYFAAQAPDTTG